MGTIIDILDSMDLSEGFSSTILKDVRLFRDSRGSSRVPLIYDPSICFILQGRKRGFLENYEFQYNPDSYLIVSAAAPMEMETFVSPDKPLYGLSLAIDPVEMNNMIAIINQERQEYSQDDRSLPAALGPAPMSPSMKGSLKRLVEALSSDTDAKILGPGLIREIYYHALRGEKGYLLFKLSQQSGNFSRIIRIMTHLYNNYDEKISVEGMAEQANMSVSAFHRAFKSIASESPMQYLKKIRLNRARDFLMERRMKSYEIAETIGYESVAQFSRDFKRFYGSSTSEFKRNALVSQAPKSY